jgi:nucleotide-binding universal stress UspA family protein
MLPFKRILCPTDFSEPALTALKRAEELARHFGAELVVAHVIPPIPGPHAYADPPVASSFDVPLYQQELAICAEKMLKELVSHEISSEVRTRDQVTTGEVAPDRPKGAGGSHCYRHSRADGLAALGLWLGG